MDNKNIKDKKFKNVKIFLNGKLHENIERSEGNEIISIYIEADGLDFISELYKGDIRNEIYNEFIYGIINLIEKNTEALIKKIKRDYHKIKG